MQNLTIQIRPTKVDDLDILFQFQQDEDAAHLAAFMPDNPSNKNAFFVVKISSFMRL